MKGFFSKKVIGRLCAGMVTATMLVGSFGTYVSAEDDFVGDEIVAVEATETEVNVDDTEIQESEIADETEAIEDTSVEITDETIEDNSEEAPEMAPIGAEYVEDTEVVSLVSGDIEYSLIGGGYTAVSYNGTSSYVNIPVQIGDYYVTAIADNFLYNKSAADIVTSVSIPYTVTKIGKNAFRDCAKLQSISFGTHTERTKGFWSDEYQATHLTTIDEYAFAGDTKIGSINLQGYGLTTVNAHAFDGCSGITSLSLPSSLNTIKTDAFNDWNGLVDFTFYGDINQWINISYGSNSKGTHPNAYAKNVRIGEYHDDGWGYGSTLFPDIKDIVVPSTVTEIKAYLFAGFSKLESVNLANVGTINEYAFSGCVNLKSIDLTNVNKVLEGAFYNCTSLQNVTVPDRLSVIGDFVFYNNAKLKTIYLGTGLSSIGSKSFYGCTVLNDIKIDKNLSTIPADAFDGCDGLTVVNVYNGSAADTYFSAKANCWIRYIDSDSKDTQVDSKLLGYSALYNGRIGMHFYFSTTGIVKDRDYVRFVEPGQTQSDDDKHYFSEAELVDGKYRFTVYIAPKDFCSKIGAKLVINGVGDSKTYWISFADYISTVLTYPNVYIGVSGDQQNTIYLVQALATYCYAAAQYFDCDTSGINTSMLLPESEFSTCGSDNAISISDKGYLGASMTLEDTMTINLYFVGHRTDINVVGLGYLYKAKVSDYVNISYIGDDYTVVSITGYQLASGGVWVSETIPVSYVLNLSYNGVTSSDCFTGFSYLWLAKNESNNTELAYLADALYTLDALANNRKDDLQVK